MLCSFLAAGPKACVGHTMAAFYLRLLFVLFAMADDSESKPDV